MYPKTKITVGKQGKCSIESLEKSDQCHKLSELGKATGKILSEEDKDHTPVFQDIHQKN